MLEIRMLPARQGDSLWIRWGNPASPRQILVDMGTEEIGTRLRERLLALPVADRRFELLVVTHVDRDHIGGVLTCLAEAAPITGLSIGDIWFNGWPHLVPPPGTPDLTHRPRQPDHAAPPGPPDLEVMGPAQGERLASWLRHQTWNAAFGGGPVCRVQGGRPPSIELADDLTVTVLGPTPERLVELAPKWQAEVAEALRKGTLTEVSAGLEAMGSCDPPVLDTTQDLENLARTDTKLDNSPANGSSIALLLEHRGRRLLLAGDAFGEDLVAGVEALGRETPLALDAFKLPHHGSSSNTTRALVDSVTCEHWLVSTDGTQFKHPDAVAIGRVLAWGRHRPAALCFNTRSTFSGWWDDPAWRRRFAYQTRYGTRADGLALSLDAVE